VSWANAALANKIAPVAPSKLLKRFDCINASICFALRAASELNCEPGAKMAVDILLQGLDSQLSSDDHSFRGHAGKLRGTLRR
jgi:hypothetical protein